MPDTYCLEDALARLSDRQREKIRELINQRALLIGALREIEGYKSEGDPFDRISAIKELARKALSKI